MRGFQDTRTAVRRARHRQPRQHLPVARARAGASVSASRDRRSRTSSPRSPPGRRSCILLIRRGAPLAPSPRAHARADARRARPRAAHARPSSRPSRLAAAVAARMGDAQLAAHQIGFQLWILVALALDSIAIAAQTLVGSLLGAGDVDAAWRARRGGCCASARSSAWRSPSLLAAGYDVIPRLFTSDQAVRDQVAILWPWFVAMMPFCGVALRARRRAARRGRPRLHAQRHGCRGARRVPAAGAGRLRRRPRDRRHLGRARGLHRRSGSPSGSCTGAGAPGSYPAR